MNIAANIVLGLIPLITLAWSIAADDRKAPADRVVVTGADRSQQTVIFALVCGLWFLTLAMWNWMTGSSPGWIILWALSGTVSLVLCVVLRRRRRSSAGG